MFFLCIFSSTFSTVIWRLSLWLPMTYDLTVILKYCGRYSHDFVASVDELSLAWLPMTHNLTVMLKYCGRSSHDLLGLCGVERSQGCIQWQESSPTTNASDESFWEQKTKAFVDKTSTLQDSHSMTKTFILQTKNGTSFFCKRLPLISKPAGTQRRVISFFLVSPGGDDAP